jgi:hypothetical protein
MKVILRKCLSLRDLILSLDVRLEIFQEYIFKNFGALIIFLMLFKKMKMTQKKAFDFFLKI